MKTPPLPSRKGKTTRRKDINGKPMVYTVEDEIVRIPKSNPEKAIYLQMLSHKEGRQEMRLCYYMICKNGKRKGKWLFGQFATMIEKEDFEYLIGEAIKRGWITLSS